MKLRFFYAALLILLSTLPAVSSDLPKNTKLEVRIEEMLSSDISQTGQKFLATLNKTVSIGQSVVLEKGSVVEGVVKLAEPTYNYRQPGELDLELVSVRSGGKVYTLNTNTMVMTGKPSPTDPRTGRPMDTGSRKGDLARATIDAAGGNRSTSSTIPGTDISVGAGSQSNSMQMIVPVKAKLTFNVSAASISDMPK
jgi:hypothetical protein